MLVGGGSFKTGQNTHKLPIDTRGFQIYSIAMDGRLNVHMTEETAQKIRIEAVTKRLTIGEFIEVLYKTYEQLNKQNKNN
jgi:hypothetical protein